MTDGYCAGVTSDKTEAEPSMGVERIAFFSDAVVAIAITLVVLPLVDAARDLGGESVGTFLYRNTYGLIAAASSFFAITIFWMWHHRFYQKVTAYTASLLWANAVWLACIVFLPVATVVNVTTDAADRVGVVLYLGTLTTSIAMGGFRRSSRQGGA